MKTWFYIGIAFLLLLGYIGVQCDQLKKVKVDRDVYKGNTSVLLKYVEQYRTNDSLNAVSVGNLELKLSEYKQYREDDLKLIKSLKVDNKRLSQITTAQTETTYDLQGTVRDSIRTVYKDRFITDTLRCIIINDKWFNLNGCTDANSKFTGTLINRDSLLYVEHIIPKRFLFIKWGVKERKQDIVSRNPHTKIMEAEFVTIRK